MITFCPIFVYHQVYTSLYHNSWLTRLDRFMFPNPQATPSFSKLHAENWGRSYKKVCLLLSAGHGRLYLQRIIYAHEQDARELHYISRRGWMLHDIHRQPYVSDSQRTRSQVHEENTITSLSRPYYALSQRWPRCIILVSYPDPPPWSASNLTLPSWLSHTQGPTNSRSPHM